MELQVFLFNKNIGILKSTSNRGIVFAYSKKYIESNGQPLSISLPLREKEFSQKECLPYFIGLLPEGSVKTRIANDLHISELSTIKLLEALGGECAGSVSFYSENYPHPQKIETKWKLNNENYLQLSKEEISSWLNTLQTRPFIYGKSDSRLSLAGAQEKISLAFFNDTWYLPKNNAPSTHILKPNPYGLLNTISINEFFCMNLAKNLNLPVPNTKLLNIDNSTIFVCERYDRLLTKNKSGEVIIERIHQEDFCQALGIPSDNKYQSDGGPSYSDCLALIQNNFNTPMEDTFLFVKTILFNYLIGNCDCHAKNYSVITDNNNNKHLAPMYDLVCTTVYDSLTKKMAMKFGSKYDIDKITKNEVIKLAEVLRIKPHLFFDVLKDFAIKIETAIIDLIKKPEFSKNKEIVYKILSEINKRIKQIEY